MDSDGAVIVREWSLASQSGLSEQNAKKRQLKVGGTKADLAGRTFLLRDAGRYRRERA